MAKDSIAALIALAGCIFLWTDVLAWSPARAGPSSDLMPATGEAVG